MTVYDRGVPPGMSDQVAAGGFKRVRDAAPVSELFRTPALYGPSLSAYTSWKKYGVSWAIFQLA